MMYADTATGRAEAAPRLRGTCPSCGAPVRPKCGTLVIWHWAHHARADCDRWSEPESDWHRQWKLAVPPERREVVMGSHRADIVTASGGVVEVQHSPISVEMIAEREQFYGDRMAWIFDATEAYAAGRISVEHHLGDWDRLEWRHARRSVEMCDRPVLLDIGDGMTLYLRHYERPPNTGLYWCRQITRESVEAWMRDGARWDVRRAPVPPPPEPPLPPDPVSPSASRRSPRLDEALSRYRQTRSPRDWAAYAALVRRAAGRGEQAVIGAAELYRSLPHVEHPDLGRDPEEWLGKHLDAER